MTPSEEPYIAHDFWETDVFNYPGDVVVGMFFNMFRTGKLSKRTIKNRNRFIDGYGPYNQ